MMITQALAEIKVLGSRIEKKHEFVLEHLARQEALKDPLIKQGGQEKLVAEAMQSISDLMVRLIDIRTAIQKKNHETNLTVMGETKTIAEWLTWRKEVKPLLESLHQKMVRKLSDLRSFAKRQDIRMVESGRDADPMDIVVNINEVAFAEEREKLSSIIERLDGELSLLNATTIIDL